MSTQFRASSIASNEVVYLIDGSSYVYRAYYAIKELSNSKGQATNAVFGFVRMLTKLLNERKPKYLAIFFDVKQPTFRHRSYKKYKANRPPMPQDLVKQIPWIEKAVFGFGISLFKMPGFEADDLIGTAARIIQNQGVSVIIVSGDKDLMQLVTDNCMLWDPMKEELIGKNEIRDKFGVDPEQMVDVMGFSGDRADNIPGVPGIGPKTALNLIKEFGSMERCYDNLETIIRKKQKEKLIKFKDQAFLSRSLVRIDVYSPIDIILKDLLVSLPDKQCLSGLFRELEFKQLQKKFTTTSRAKRKYYTAITSMTSLKKLVFQLTQCKSFAFDTETTSINAMMACLVGIGISMKQDEAFYIPVGHDYSGAPQQLTIKEVLDVLRPLLTNPNIGKIGQNIKYDSLVLLRYGVVVNGVKSDTMLASYLIDPSKRSHSLDQIALDFLEHKNISYEEVTGKGKHKIPFNKVLLEKATKYACEDVDITFSANNVLIPILEKAGLIDLMQKVEMPLVPVLIRMENRGVRVDEKTLHKLSISFQDQLVLLKKQIYEATGEVFNINSSQQLGHILFDKLKLPVQKRSKIKKGYSTDVSVLNKLLPYHIIPSLILQYRSLTKLKSTYVDAMLGLINCNTGRIHTSFNQTVTSTGRLSSSNPNLQNIPIRTKAGREIRKAFVPKDKCVFLSADYSQIELRILAHYSEDEILIKSFRNHEDIHTRTASELFNRSPEKINEELRRQAKIVNFGIIYGMSAYRLANDLGISNKMAQAYISNYFLRYKGVKNFISKTISEAVKTKRISTLLGRTRQLAHIASNNMTLRKNAERAALNTVIQGTAADLIKMAMINLDVQLDKKRLKTAMLLSVHDEIMLEVPCEELDQVKMIVRKTMETVFDLIIPLKVNISHGKNWAEVH